MFHYSLPLRKVPEPDCLTCRGDPLLAARLGVERIADAVVSEGLGKVGRPARLVLPLAPGATQKQVHNYSLVNPQKRNRSI